MRYKQNVHPPLELSAVRLCDGDIGAVVAVEVLYYEPVAAIDQKRDVSTTAL